MKKIFFINLTLCMLFMLVGCKHLITKDTIDTNTAFGIVSFDNATISAAKQLSEAFINEGDKQNIKIYRGTPDKASYFIKGYFSVIIDDKPSENMILYVFDIVDKNGIRLHRTQGKYMLNRILIPANDSFWASINKNGYDEIARQTISQLTLWLKTNPLK